MQIPLINAGFRLGKSYPQEDLSIKNVAAIKRNSRQNEAKLQNCK
ncbi:MAG: hypothetical protein ACREPR_15805 [Brasilonema sp.]